MTLAATARSAAIGATLAFGACADTPEAGREIVWESDRAAPSSTAQSAAVAGPPGLDADGCREYTQTIRIDGEEQQAFGRACMQQDGSWRIHVPPQAPGAQPAARAVPVYYPYPAYYAPYYPPPFFFGSAFRFSDRHHHHHGHHHHGHRNGHRR